MIPSRLLGKFELGVFIALFTSGCAGRFIGLVGSEPPVSNLQIEAQQRFAPAVETPAMTVHIDPNTGEFIPPPAVPLLSQIPQPLAGAAAAPLPELAQTLSPVPGGGVMIQLDERFSAPLTATIDADGKVRVEHQTRPEIY